MVTEEAAGGTLLILCPSNRLPELFRTSLGESNLAPAVKRRKETRRRVNSDFNQKETTKVTLQHRTLAVTTKAHHMSDHPE